MEGLTEELLIRSYLDSKQELSNIEVISFHKGFTKIMDIWMKVNQNTANRLGIVRDYDNQEKAKKEHEKYFKPGKLYVETTVNYTLEPEIVRTGNNYSILLQKCKDSFGWAEMPIDEFIEKWREAKAEVMLEICKDLATGDLPGFEMPAHIENIINFLNEENN